MINREDLERIFNVLNMDIPKINIAHERKPIKIVGYKSDITVG